MSIRRQAVARAGWALAAGLLFGLGLAVSDMVNPHKVLGFLDILGAWDPSLAGVMATAIPVTALIYRLAASRPASLTGAPIPPPPARPVDRRLVAGALVFGAGWGMVGFCPGPAIAALVLDARVWIFVAAMMAGMLAFRWLVPADPAIPRPAPLASPPASADTGVRARPTAR